jgi:hypothetical protein
MMLVPAAPEHRSAARSVGRTAFGVRAATAIAVALSFECTPSGLEVSSRPSLLEPAAPLERQTSPGEWRYHPRQPSRLARAYPLPLGAKLFVGELGERWLVEAKAERALPASILAPEALIGALPPRGAGWTFVGQSGATYDAESPLGPFLASSAPLERMAKVDSGVGNLLGVSRAGRLLSSQDAGGSWHAVGPPSTRFADVLLVPPHALALAVPERIWWSADEGAQWQPLDAPPFGARTLERDEDAGPIVVSALGAYGVRFEGAPVISPLARSPRPDEPKLDVPPSEGPSAKALAGGHAFVSQGRYFEVELGVRAEVISGDFTGRLARRKLPTFSACQDLRVAGFGAWVYAACTRERGGPTRIYEFFRSEDGGESFERESYTVRGSDQAKLATGDGGTLVATGFCLPEENVPGCRPRGILARRARGDAGAGSELYAAPAPALEDHALALTFSADGRTAYAVGQRTKSDSLFMFVSNDLTTGFDARPITRLDGEGATGSAQVAALTAATDGQVSLVFTLPSGPARIGILDARGQTLSLNAAPIENASLGAYGARALAIGADEAWESLNGGASWDSIGRMPRSPCPNANARCAAPVQCTTRGCAIGDSSSRVGWRGQARLSTALLSPAAAARSAPRRSVGKPFTCELSDPEWHALRGVERLPDASQAALGKVSWYALSTDDATAGVGLWISDSERSANHDGVRFSELLAPKERASESAYLATLQVEGAAALRYEVPGAPPTSSTHLQNIEIAWENLLDGSRGRGSIRDAGPFLPGDFAKGEGAARRAQTDLISIASGGIFVRPHKNPQHQQTTYFLDGSRISEIPPLRWPSAPKGASSEMARVGGHDLALLFVNQGATVVRGRQHGDSWRFDAMSVGFANAEDFALRQHRDIAYVGGQAGIHLALLGAGGQSEAHVYPFQAEGAVFAAGIAVPTQASLEDGAPSCSAEQRASTPRIVAPHQPGARRPVLVHDPVEPLRLLLTDLAILHGTPARPCAMVFDADTVRAAAAPQPLRERALIAARGPSFLFRTSPDPARRDARVEYRRMQCRADASAEVPSEVYEMPGTRTEEP